VTRILGVLGILILLYAVLFGTHEQAGTFGNLIDVANYQGRYGLLTLGVGLVIIVGGIDLSIGSVVGCAAILFGLLMMKGVHPFAALPLVLLFGVFVGLVNGLLITQLRLQSFLVTLCGMFIIRGVGQIIAQPIPYMGTVSFANVRVTHPSYESTLLSLRYWLIGKSPTDAELLFPAQFILLLILAAVVGFFLHRTAYGRYWYAIGHSELAAKYAGVNVNRQRIAVYVVCSALAALVGVLLFLNEPSVQSDNAGQMWELYAILGAVLGGCSLRGGEGTAVGMVLGAMVLPVLETLVSFRGLKNDVIPAVIGLTLLLGTIVDELIRRRSRARP
jgi:ribose transport system permease protein